MNCETCKERKMQAEPVPYIVHESAMARAERANKRWFWAWLITLLLLVGAVVWYIWWRGQWEVKEKTVSYEVEQQAERNGNNSFIGGDYYGFAESESNKNNKDKNP